MPIGHAERLMPTLRRIVTARESAARSDGELLAAFVAARDADAFAELLRRHGPMVLGVCRRVVGDRATADDAFQATFLVLARRAAAVRPREQVGNWLYGVAYRTALKARTVLARRRARERQVDVMPEPTAPPAAPAWGDLQAVIDEELAKLPAKLRVPVVLCDLEGRAQREVARHLNVPAATLATRLATARRALAARLTRRGVTLSGGALAGLLCTHASASAVPPVLVGGLARAAEAVAGGGPVGALVSANAVHLSEGVLRMMMLVKLKAVAVTALTVLALTTGLGLGLVPAAAVDEPGTPGPRAAAPDLPARVAPPVAPAASDDATFLRRLSMHVRGLPPTPVEMFFFVSDADADKRAKVVTWMTDDDELRAAVAKKLGVPVERVKVVRVEVAADAAPAFPHATITKQVRPIEVAVAGTPGKRVTLRVNPQDTFRAQTGDKVVLNTLDIDRVFAGADLRAYELLKLAQNPHDVTGRAPPAFIPFDVAKPIEGYRYDVLLAGNDTTVRVWDAVIADTDAEFLARVLKDVRGSAPTALESKYFAEDKDPKKREKLLDTLLKDAAVQKKLGDAWKAKMLAPAAGTARLRQDYWLYVQPDVVKPKVEVPYVAPPAPPKPPSSVTPKFVIQPPPIPPAPPAGKFEKLVDELITAKKSDEAILEALTLATMGRLPTESEKKLTLAGIAGAKDRKAAWVAIAKALAPDAKFGELRFRVIDPK
jgi:RNA polymerase sigma factor (sigma-70 family)